MHSTNLPKLGLPWLGWISISPSICVYYLANDLLQRWRRLDEWSLHASTFWCVLYTWYNNFPCQRRERFDIHSNIHKVEFYELRIYLPYVTLGSLQVFLINMRNYIEETSRRKAVLSRLQYFRKKSMFSFYWRKKKVNCLDYYNSKQTLIWKLEMGWTD